jgi:hypothetical protein
MSRTRFGALVLALLLSVSGCGDEDDGADRFRQDYNAAVEPLSKINSDIGDATGGAAGQSNRAIAGEFDRIADTAAKTRSALSGLEPPEDAKDEFDELLAALEKGVSDLRAVAKAARADNPQAANEAVESLSESGEEISEAENALKRAVDGG